MECPAFLAKRKDRWPADVTCTNLDFSVVGEIKEDEARLEVCNTFVVAAKRPEVRLASVIDCEKFSKLSKLLCITTFVLRFIKNCRNPTNREVREQPQIEEMHSALLLWHKEVQQHLQEENESLGVFEDEHGVLRCKGRV